MPDASLTALYQDVILDHYRRPRNKGVLDGASVAVPMRNPLCGDEITVELLLEGDRVADVRFTGRGCSISQASASMMTELVKGKQAGEIETLRGRFRAMVMGDARGRRGRVAGSGTVADGGGPVSGAREVRAARLERAGAGIG